MNLTDVTTLAHSLMAEHGIAENGWTFQFDNAHKRMGACHYQTKTITVSRHFALAADESEVRDTLLHEIAHVIAGYLAGHQIQWKVVARRIGATPKACGANPHYRQVRADLTKHATTHARSLPADSPVLVTTRAKVGDRVVICGPYQRPARGTVMVVTAVNRTRYVLHDERYKRDFAIPFPGARLHIEGEPLDRTTPMPAEREIRTKEKEKLCSDPDEVLRSGDAGVILRGRFRGTQFTVTKRNPKTYVGVLAGTEYRIPHNMVGRAA